MEHDYLDKYSNLSSPVHSFDPRLKLILFLIFVFSVTTTKINPMSFLTYLAILLSVLLISRIPAFFVFKRSLVLCPFVVLPVFFSVFFIENGFFVFISVLSKALLSITATALLVSTTPFPKLLKSLQSIGIPKIFITVISFMYRYVFVLTDEVVRMSRAKQSRCFRGSFIANLRFYGNMLGCIFIRSYERGEMVYSAMLSRGFDGEIKTSKLSPMRKTEGMQFALFSTCLLLLWIWFYAGY